MRRSSGSTKRDIRSAPTTSTCRARPASTWAAASDSPDRKPVQAAPTSNAPAAWRRSPRHERRSVGQQVVLAHGGHDHEVELRGVELRPPERVAARRGGQVGEAIARPGHAPLADARAAEDPVLRDPEALGDRAVAYDGLGQARPDRGDAGGGNRPARSVRGAGGNGGQAVEGCRRVVGHAVKVPEDGPAHHAPSPASPRLGGSSPRMGGLATGLSRRCPPARGPALALVSGPRRARPR